MNENPVALVTGASRGIGKATALRLAEHGFDVAITARTEREGEGRTEPGSVRGDEDVLTIPGSLESTAKEVEARGRRALPIRMDLLDARGVAEVPGQVLEGFGRVDVLVNNAIYQGTGSMDRILDLTAASMTNLVVGNYVHQVLLTQGVIPHMVERGAGRIVNMVSASARRDPRAPAGAGGWGIGYSASKAAFGRVAGGINAEFGPAVLCFNVDPGNVVTEKRRARGPDEFSEHYGSESPDATALVISWLATRPEAADQLGHWIYAPTLSTELGLL